MVRRSPFSALLDSMMACRRRRTFPRGDVHATVAVLVVRSNATVLLSLMLTGCVMSRHVVMKVFLPKG